jgi:hypothetical protein
MFVWQTRPLVAVFWLIGNLDNRRSTVLVFEMGTS